MQNHEADTASQIITMKIFGVFPSPSQGKPLTSSEELLLRISKAERFVNEQILLTATLNARLAALQAELLGVHSG